MSSGEPVVLYSYWRSSCSWRVRIALALKEIHYQYVAVNLLESKQSSEDYAQRNPSKLVPTLEIDGHTLNQSIAIMEYLEETRGDQGVHLLPTSDPYKRQLVRQICQMIASDIQPIQNLRVLKKIKEDFNTDEAAKSNWGKYWIENGFVAVEKVLEKHSGKFCVGDQVSMADICLVPQVYNAKRFNVDMSKFPNIVRIEQACSELEAFKKAHPDQQVDKV
ncbi:hypothetical protein FDP41_004439 [Naegleria fowleri]|uniref:Maleylacetoacetate isomerase n=1 Tax=Naegleria fowleri TaxID=5763 RepID=A0A6A5BRU8_NAEFO|nr:uncharacterized protein FDP41_004439 [Naegleria fowleri]KAF0976540.1 hypothetical protein FDP41_004439 [Naegleria fowleri]CAG4707947.1 unnamed protein product [Naegleria fowleri]